MTITDSVRSTLSSWGEHQSFIELHPGSAALFTSAHQCLIDIAALAAQLHAWGVRPRQLVPIFIENSVDFIYIFLALLELKAIPILAKLDFRRMELDEVFANCLPQAIISESRHLPILKPYLTGIAVIERSQGRLRLSQTAEQSLVSQDIPDDIASINYTYRGNGYPLGAMVSHAQYLQGARVLQNGLQGLGGEKMLLILPMAHIFTLIGCILVPLLYRMTTVIACTLHPRHLFKYIAELQIDHICSVPEIYEMLFRLRDPALDLHSLKVFVSGGSLLTGDSFTKIKRAFAVDLLHGYGLTEFTPISRNVRLRARPNTVGTVGEGIECRIHSPNPEGIGEIQVKTPNIASGYFRRPKETREAFQNGWFRTGDLGYIENDHLVFVKELKKTRKINGNIVDLEELRRAIKQDPDVANCCVSCEGNSLTAKIAVHSRIDIQEKERDIRARLRGLLAEYKIPRQVGLL